MNDLVVYSSLLSANGRKVQSVCVQLGISAQIVDTNIYVGEGQSESYLKINPLGQIPALKASNIIITESNAIMIYLAEKYGNQSLYSQVAEERAEINRWLFWESSQWQPLLIKIMEKHVGHRLLPSIVLMPTDKAYWEEDASVVQLNYLDSYLSDLTYLVGDRLTLADLCVGAMTTYFKVANFPFEQYEHISKWMNTLSKTKAWQLTEHQKWT